MSSKNINPNNHSKSRTYGYNLKNKQSRKKKAFYYPKNKKYTEELNSSPSKNIQENQSEKINSNYSENNFDTEKIYEDEYQGLIYSPLYPNINENTIYYYIEKERDDFNNFRTKWKTEICRYWEMYGECKYGDNCAFAHGDSELKQRKMTFNYKTKPCKQFFELGYCTYGSRCQFSHKKEEDLKDQKNEIENKNNNVSYLKIIEELLSEENKISHELVKRPRLMTFENITHCTLEESENSKLQLYKDIIDLKNDKSKSNKNISFKVLEDTDSKSNSSNDNVYDKVDC